MNPPLHCVVDDRLIVNSVVEVASHGSLKSAHVPPQMVSVGAMGVVGVWVRVNELTVGAGLAATRVLAASRPVPDNIDSSVPAVGAAVAPVVYTMLPAFCP